MWAIAGLTQWVGSLMASEPEDQKERTAEEILKDPFEPQVLDVIVVKAMLVNGLHLPPELVDSIIDHAEYWPHTSTEVNFTKHPSGFHTVGFLTTAEDSENELLVSPSIFGSFRLTGRSSNLPCQRCSPFSFGVFL